MSNKGTRYKEAENIGPGKDVEDVEFEIAGKGKFKAKKVYRKQMLLRIPPRLDEMITTASLLLNKPKNQFEIEFHERFLVAFMQEKGLDVIKGEVFSR